MHFQKDERLYIWYLGELGQPCDGQYKTLKEIDFKQLQDEFKTLPEEKQRDKNGFRINFEEWLTKEGYIEYIDARHIDFDNFSHPKVSEFKRND